MHTYALSVIHRYISTTLRVKLVFYYGHPNVMTVTDISKNNNKPTENDILIENANIILSKHRLLHSINGTDRQSVE